MDLHTYESLTKDESTARKYLLGFCFKNQQRICPQCNSRKLYKLNTGYRRCKRCFYTFHDFSGRWINSGSLTPGQWLRIIKLFELELSTRKISQQLRIAYNTAHKAIMTIRSSILAHAADAQQMLSQESASW